MSKLREAARDQSCIACGAQDGTVVLAHYTGVMRGLYGGGLGIKCHDLIGAHLCHGCHSDMDTYSRNKDQRWIHSEEFQHLILKTILRLLAQGKIQVT